MQTSESAGTPVHQDELRSGQEVHVRLGSQDLGTGRVDAVTEDGEAVWVIFGGATPRRLFLIDDQAEFTLLSVS
jgi:hypothetical protein